MIETWELIKINDFFLGGGGGGGGEEGVILFSILFSFQPVKNLTLSKKKKKRKKASILPGFLMHCHYIQTLMKVPAHVFVVDKVKKNSIYFCNG